LDTDASEVGIAFISSIIFTLRATTTQHLYTGIGEGKDEGNKSLYRRR